MQYTKLPRRVFNSPLLQYANFDDGAHVNLIRLTKPYANGVSYAVYSTSGDMSGMFKFFEDAQARFEGIVEHRLHSSNLVKRRVVPNNFSGHFFLEI